jgi:hypothetical protein
MKAYASEVVVEPTTIVELIVPDGMKMVVVLMAEAVCAEIFRNEEQKGVALCSFSTSTIRTTF